MTTKEYIIMLNNRYDSPNTYVINPGVDRVNAYGILTIDGSNIILKKGSIIRDYESFIKTSSIATKSNIKRRATIKTQKIEFDDKTCEVVSEDFACSSRTAAVVNVALVSTAKNYIHKLVTDKIRYVNTSNKTIYATNGDNTITIDKNTNVKIIKSNRDSMIGKTANSLGELSRTYGIDIYPSEWTGSFNDDGIMTDFKLTEYINIVNSIKYEEDDNKNQEIQVIDTNKFEKFTFDEKLKQKLIRTAKRDKALLLTGTPGGGKTTWAKYIAYSLTESVTSDRIEIVQFSPSTGYSNFMEGLSANDKGFFEVMKSTFLKLCDRALDDRENTYVLIIDEINRCRVTDVIGELLNMIEARGEYIRTNNGLLVTMPDNIVIIATMNTFDSGASELPYALRTRFAEYEITGQNIDIRKLIGNDANSDVLETADEIWTLLKNINNFIAELKKTSAYCIGPRPFGSNIKTIEDLMDIVESRILKDIKIVLKTAYNNTAISEEIRVLEKFADTGILDMEDAF